MLSRMRGSVSVSFPSSGLLLQVGHGCMVVCYALSSACRIPLVWQRNRLGPIYGICFEEVLF